MKELAQVQTDGAEGPLHGIGGVALLQAAAWPPAVHDRAILSAQPFPTLDRTSAAVRGGVSRLVSGENRPTRAKYPRQTLSQSVSETGQKEGQSRAESE